MAFQIKDRTKVSISKANITGYWRCKTPLFAVATTETFALDDSIVDGGPTGIDFSGAATPTTATLTGTTLRNMGSSGLDGDTVMLTMTGGELSNAYHGLSASGGAWTLNNVTLKQNRNAAVWIEGGGETSSATLAMHGCAITNNEINGVYLFDYVVADLGTVDNPGNNTFLANTNLGLHIAGLLGARLITAVGNTWLPNVQGSDAAGRYPVVAIVPGPVDPSPGNFAIAAGWSLQR